MPGQLSAALHKTDKNQRMGWIVTFASLAALVPSTSAVMLSSMSFYIEPVTSEFGWTRAQFMAPVSFSQLILAIATPFAGYLGDRYGIRPFLLGGIIIFALSTMALGLIGDSLVVYAIITLTVWFSGTAQTTLYYAKAIVSWFDKNRGLALAIGMTGVPLGQVLLQPLVAWLVSEHGWRAARMVTGGLVLVVSLPCIYFFIRERTVRGKVEKIPGHTFIRLISSPVFQLLCAVFFLSGVALLGLLVQFVPVLEERGVPLVSIAGGLSALALVQIFSRLGSGYLLDRVHSPRIVIVWFAMGIIGFLLLVVAQDDWIIILAMMLIGAAMGAEMEIAAYFAARYFGLARYGGVFGLLTSAYAFGAASGGLGMSIIRDMTGSYLLGVELGIVALIGACICIVLLPAYPKE